MRSSFETRGYRFNWRSFITPGVKLVVLACAGAFLAQTLIDLFIGARATSWINHFFGLVPLGVFPGLRLWQPFTYIFLHGGIGHLLINMLILWMFGRDLELVWGKRRFLNYFLWCGAGAGLINVIVKTIPLFWGSAPSDVPTIGASGAIYGILIANAVLFPDRQVWLFPLPLAIPMRPFVAVMGAIEFFYTLGSGGDRVAHICHLAGMLVGYIYLRRGSFLYRARNRFADWKQQRTRRKFEVYMRDHRKEPPPPDHWVN